MKYSTEVEKGKSGIHINPKNKGKFTATKKATGKSTEELTHSKNPLTRKRAVFAQNAARWAKKHQGGGKATKTSLLTKPKTVANIKSDERVDYSRKQLNEAIQSGKENEFWRQSYINKMNDEYNKQHYLKKAKLLDKNKSSKSQINAIKSIISATAGLPTIKKGGAVKQIDENPVWIPKYKEQSGGLSKSYIKEAKEKPGGSNVGNKTFADGSKRTGPYVGPSGGAPKGSYPVPDKKHADAALRLSHNAPNPGGIKQAVYKKYPELKKHQNGGSINLDITKILSQ